MLIICPECFAKISDKAVTCPKCGYTSKNALIPISNQEKITIAPDFQYEIKGWNPEREWVCVLPIQDNQKLFEFFGNIEKLEKFAPEIADIIKKMASEDNILVAEINPYIQKLIDQGKYKLSVDSDGKILPTIRDAHKIIKQVRLKKVKLPKDISSSVQNLTLQASMTQILDQIEYIGEAVQELQTDILNDRIALSESAWEKLAQARKIQDLSLRQASIINIVNGATDAKKRLMRNFTSNLRFIEAHSDQSFGETLFDHTKAKKKQDKSNDAFNVLIAITNSVQVECEGYAMIGEYEASKECLIQFSKFIENNKLNERDTLLLLNENSKQDQIEKVNKFSLISENIKEFNASGCLKYDSKILIDGGKRNANAKRNTPRKEKEKSVKNISE